MCVGGGGGGGAGVKGEGVYLSLQDKRGRICTTLMSQLPLCLDKVMQSWKVFSYFLISLSPLPIH